MFFSPTQQQHPEHQKVTVLRLDQEADFYEQDEYRVNQIMQCSTFPDLQLTANEILQPQEL